MPVYLIVTLKLTNRNPKVTEFFNMACQESGIAIMPGLPVVESWIAPEGK